MATLLEEPPIVQHARPVETEDRYECETVDGIDVEMPPMSAEAKGIATDLALKLSVFGTAQNVGKAYVEVKIQLPSERNLRRIPDLIFVPSAVWPVNLRLPDVNAWKIVPDICVEVISPNDLHLTYEDKLDEYLAAGVKQVWLVNPRTSTLRIYESPDRLRTLRRKDTLAGIEFLPGFELPLGEIFLDAAPAAG